MTIEYPGSAYRASAKGARFGYLFLMRKMSFSREMLLNIFLMSKDTSARDGRHCLCCGCVMYFSTPFLIVCMTMSQPPWTPTAKLKGSRCCANSGVNCFNMAIAVIRLMAEGMPSGRSLVLSSGSFSKATRYVVRRILIMAGGISAFAIFWKKVQRVVGLISSG